MPESASWDVAGLQAITATPWCFKKQDQGEAGQVIFRPTPTGAQPEEPDPIGAGGPRAVYIKKKDFDQHGYTDNCRKCQAMPWNDVSQPTLGHTERCRTRMSETMAKGSEDQKKRILAATNRADEFFAKQVEEATERWRKRKAETPESASPLRPRLPAPAAEAQQT